MVHTQAELTKAEHCYNQEDCIQVGQPSLVFRLGSHRELDKTFVDAIEVIIQDYIQLITKAIVSMLAAAMRKTILVQLLSHGFLYISTIA
jgi:hypothetical protein